MTLLLFVVAILLAVVGIMRLVHGEVLVGILLLVAAAAVGPGGWSIWGNG